MKYVNKFTLAGLLFTNCSAFAATPMEGWYAGLMGGLSYTPSVKVQSTQFSGVIPATPVRIPPLPGIPFNAGIFNSSLTYSLGGNGGAQVGYRICNFRFEGELLYNYAPYSQLKTDFFLNVFSSPPFSFNSPIIIKRRQTAIFAAASPFVSIAAANPGFLRFGGRTAWGAGLFNAYYDFYDEENDPTWVPYLGLGIGYAYIQNRVSINFYNALGTFITSSTISKNSSTPIGQGIIGVSYYYSDTTAIGLDYRYITTNTIASLNTRVKTNTLNLNFNYWFDDN